MLKKLFFLTSFLFSIAFISAEESLLNFSAGISSGGVIYTNPEIKVINEVIETPTPLNFGLDFYINLNPIKEVTFFAGTDFFFSLNSKNNQFFNHLFLNLPFGFKIYPNLKGFCFGSAYVPGFRKDFINAANIEDSEILNCEWTNGFKFLIEYNFAHTGKIKYLPTIGFSWTCMPRKNYQYDHLLLAYVNINF